MAVFLLLVSILALLSDGLADDGTQDLKQLELGTGNESGCYDQLMSEISYLRQALSEEVRNRKEVNEEVNNLKKAVGRQQKDLLDSVPLGTILPWVNKPSQDSLHQEDLPLGFALCDGSLITEGIWVGEPTPDLTRSGKFLRGGNASQVLDMEESMIQDHMHIDSGHSHTDAGHTHDDSGHDHPFEDEHYYEGDTEWDPDLGGSDQWRHSLPTSTSKTTSSSYANIEISYASIESSTSGMSGVSTEGGIQVGEEVRPTNMRVLFIMKVASAEARSNPESSTVLNSSQTA